MMDINLDLLQWFINFLIKRLQAEQLKTKIFLIKNQLKNYANQLLKNSKKERYNQKYLDEELHIPIIRKFKKRKVQSPLIGNVLDADLAINKQI